MIGLFVGSNGSGWLVGASEDLMPGVNQGGSNPQREQDLWELYDGFVRAYDGFVKKKSLDLCKIKPNNYKICED